MAGNTTFAELYGSGWFATTLTILFFVIATVLSVVLYRRGRNAPRLTRVIADTQLVAWRREDEATKGLEIRYDGKVVPRVTSTTLGIWNEGRTTFREQDITPRDPLRLVCPPGTHLLRATVEATSRSAIGARVEIVGEEVHIGWDFLDPGDGFRLSLIHSGRSGDATIAGTIIGLPSGPSLREPGKAFLLFFRAFGAVFILAALVMVGYMMFVTLVRGTWVSRLAVVAFVAAVPLMILLQRMDLKIHRERRIRGVPQAVSQDPALYRALSIPQSFRGEEVRLEQGVED